MYFFTYGHSVLPQLLFTPNWLHHTLLLNCLCINYQKTLTGTWHEEMDV